MAKRTKKKNILDMINSDEAHVILKILIEKDKEIAGAAEQIAKQVLRNINVDGVAYDVYFNLDNIEVKEVWNNSGRTIHGYVEPIEIAGEMFEGALEPFLEEIKKYQKLSMNVEAKILCMGILKGLHKFKEESTTEFAEYVEDAPKNYSKIVFDSWKQGSKNNKDKKVIEDFIRKIWISERAID